MTEQATEAVQKHNADNNQASKIASITEILEKTRQQFSQDESTDNLSGEAKNTDKPQVKKKDDNALAKEEKKTTISEKADKEDIEEMISIAKSEWEKQSRRAQDGQKWGTDLSRKLKSYESKVKSLFDEGSLTEEEAKTLLNHVAHEARESATNPLQTYMQIWDQEIENMRRYGADQEIDKKIHSFQHFLQNATEKEIADVIETLESHSDDSIEITKKMLELGKNYYDDAFGELYEAGNLKNLTARFRKELDNKQKVIDKLEKQLSKYKKDNEDYLPPSTYDLPYGSKEFEGEQKGKPSITSSLARYRS